MTNILVIPDCQVKPGVPLDHLRSLSKLIIERQPSVIINLGDFYDLPSLSSYDVGKKAMEGRRLMDDIYYGNHAMGVLLGDLKDLQEQQRKNKKKVYNPEMHFLVGNHENRLERHIESNPQLEGVIGYDSFNLSDWTVHPFKSVLNHSGISFSHYFYNPLSGVPIGGSIDNRLNKLQGSFVQGHQQVFMYGQKQTLTGTHHGLVAGAFYMHNEEYIGPQAQDHWRGIVMLNNAHNGEYDLEVISLNRLMKMY